MSVPVFSETPVYQARKASDYVVREGIGNVMAKLKAGQEVRVAYLGGSITETGDGWRPQTTSWMKKKWPNAKIVEIHAAIGATGSELGVFRLEKHVLQYKPDLLFLEFAVNDGGCSPEKIWRQFEGIIRKTWRVFPKTDIVFCYTIVSGTIDIYRRGNYPETANAMEQIADFYGIPSINFGPRVVKMLDEGKLIFKGENAPKGVVLFSKDATHPIADGSALYVEDVARAFEAMKLSKPIDHFGKLQKIFIENNLENAAMVPIDESMLQGSWRKLGSKERYGNYNHWLDQVWAAGTPGSRIDFKFKGSAVSIADIPSTNGGQVWVTVDGIKSGPFQRTHYPWWSKISVFPLASGLDPNKIHTVAVELDSVIPLRQKDPKVKPEYYDGLSWLVGQILLTGELVDEKGK